MVTATMSARSPTIGIDVSRDLLLAEDGQQRSGYGLQLQRDIGHGADHRDQRHDRGDELALAVARGDEVGDRGDVLRLGEPQHLQDQRIAEADHQDRPEIDGQEIEAPAWRRGRPSRRRSRRCSRPRAKADRSAGGCRSCPSGRACGRHSSPLRKEIRYRQAQCRRRPSLAALLLLRHSAHAGRSLVKQGDHSLPSLSMPGRLASAWKRSRKAEA